MNRRAFLQRLLTGAAVAATPNIIFDMGANLYKPKYWVGHDPAFPIDHFVEWEWVTHPVPLDPNKRVGYFMNSEVIGVLPMKADLITLLDNRDVLRFAEGHWKR